MSVELVQLGHGSGGTMTRELVERVFMRRLANPELARMDDAARLALGGGRFALTTDCFVVSPRFFPGGDIGKLAICGTVNDLVVSGARPVALTAGFILEEGLPFEELEAIAESMARTAREAGVAVIAGDTKVVPRGAADGCFINTTGVGELVPGAEVGAHRAKAGDWVLVTGPVGEHGAAIAVSRSGLQDQSPIVSDCAPLGGLLLPVLAEPDGLHAMRDATRGGFGTVLCELAESSGVSIHLEERKVPVSRPVQVLCELMGLDPFFLACEGRAVVIGERPAIERALARLAAHPLGRGAAIVGEVRAGAPEVVCATAIGGHRLLTIPSSEPLPRIC